MMSIATSLFPYGVQYNPFMVLFGFILLVLIIYYMIRQRRKVRNGTVPEGQLQPANLVFSETDVLGLQKPTMDTLVSDKPGIKNPRLVFSMLILILLTLLAGFTIKFNILDSVEGDNTYNEWYTPEIKQGKKAK